MTNNLANPFLLNLPKRHQDSYVDSVQTHIQPKTHGTNMKQRLIPPLKKSTPINVTFAEKWWPNLKKYGIYVPCIPRISREISVTFVIKALATDML